MKRGSWGLYVVQAKLPINLFKTFGKVPFFSLLKLGVNKGERKLRENVFFYGLDFNTSDHYFILHARGFESL